MVVCGQSTIVNYITSIVMTVELPIVRLWSRNLQSQNFYKILVWEVIIVLTTRYDPTNVLVSVTVISSDGIFIKM